MSMTFSRFNSSKSNTPKFPINNTQNTQNNENNFIQKIEAAKNFSRQFSAKLKPTQDIQNGNIQSVVFPIGIDNANHFVSYEYWTLEDGAPTYYTITVSGKDLQLDSISTEYGYTVPTTAFRVNDRNEVELVYYGSCRR